MHHLRVFVMVVAEQSYSKAAGRLFISQPAVFAQVRRLEADLSVRLLEMRGREMRLTRAGEMVYQAARRIVNLADEVRGRVQALADGREGRLRIGASSTPGVYILPGLLTRYEAVYPGIQVQWEIQNSGTIQGRMLAGELDIGLVGEVEELHGELELRPVASDQLCVVGSVSRPDWPARPVSPPELAALPLLVREPGSSTRRVLERRLAELGLHLRPLQEVGSTEAIKQAARAGMGYGVISRLAAEDELQAGRLREVTISGLDLSRTLFALLLREGERPHEVKKLLAFLDGRHPVSG
jgi:DNA-binding transcriptional LysR family regulator